jgi:hypothetical protein
MSIAAHIRGLTAGIAIASGVLYAGHADLQEQLRQEIDASERTVRLEAAYHAKQRECSRRKRHAAMDTAGQWVCTDDAPAWAMARPVK